MNRDDLIIKKSIYVNIFNRIFSLCLIVVIVFSCINCIPGEIKEDLYVYCREALYKIEENESDKYIKEEVLKPSYDDLSDSFMLPPFNPPYFFTNKMNNYSYSSKLNYPLISHDLSSIMSYTWNTEFPRYDNSVYSIWIYKRDSKKTILPVMIFKDLFDNPADIRINYAWFSPSKDEIFFIINNFRRIDLWKTDLNLKNIINLTKDLKNGLFNAFLNNPVIVSSNGEKILFYTGSNSDLRLWIMDSNGGKKIDINKEIEKGIDNNGDYYLSINSAKFTPDSMKIVFNMSIEQRIEGSTCLIDKSIWSINTDTTEKRNLTKDLRGIEPGNMFAISPKSNYVVFLGLLNKMHKDYGEKTADIYIMNIDGTSKKNLTIDFEKIYGKKYYFYNYPSFISFNSSVIFSPDGNKIMFEFTYAKEKEYEYDFTFYTMNIDGDNKIDILKDAKKNYPELNKCLENKNLCLYFYPSFTPDSQNVTFISLNGPDLWIVSSDGKKYKNLSKKFDLDIWNGFIKIYQLIEN